MKRLHLSARHLQATSWVLAGITTAISLIIWGQYLDWDLSGLSNYDIFPVLGLIAFGLMWGHYIVAALRKLSGHESSVTRQYFESTSVLVLALIFLHPGLLIAQLWKDGFGLPPDSYLDNYVAPGLAWAALLGTLSLVVFLLFELRHWFAGKSWWRFVGYASDVAMIAIIVHGFRLGTHLQDSWFQAVWLLYAFTLLICFGILYRHKRGEKESV